ncbi:hypothetical protein [Streptomyces somaliensis]|nr:hypothetical protein [Streptomyces somaliensis]
MWRHRPNRSPDGRHDGGGTTRVAARLLGGFAGGTTGAVAGSLLGLPVWAGALAVAVALVGAVLLAARDWTRSVDAWWRDTGAEYAERVLSDVDRLLAETAVHDWLLADARHHCADGARAASLLLRALAATADAYGEGDGPAVPAPRGTRPGPAARQAPPAGPDGGTEQWEWDTWGDSSADDGWYDAAPPARPGPAPADGGPYADAPHGTAAPTAPRRTPGTRRPGRPGSSDPPTRPSRARRTTPTTGSTTAGRRPAPPRIRRGWSGSAATADRTWSTPSSPTSPPAPAVSSPPAGRGSSATPPAPGASPSTRPCATCSTRSADASCATRRPPRPRTTRTPGGVPTPPG